MAKLNRFTNAPGELVMRARLRVAAREGWHPRDEVAVAVSLDDDVEPVRSICHCGAIVSRDPKRIKVLK
jgi:hypothetical protein